MAFDRNTELLERLVGLMEGRGGMGGGGRARGQPTNDEINTLLQRSKEAAKEFNSLRNGIRFTTKQQLAFRDASGDASTRLSELNSVLSQYRSGQISLSKEQKKAIEAERARLAKLEEGTAANEKFKSGVIALRQNLEQFGTQMIQGNAQVVQAIQSGASGFTIAGTAMVASIQLQNTAVQTMTGMATQAGGALMNFGGIIGKIAGAGIVLGAQFMGLQSALKAQAKQLQIQTLMAGGEQILKAYQEMTAAGASYVGGLQQVQKALAGSDYTLQDFSAMVKANSETLAKANMSVSDAALMFGRVGAIFDRDGKKVRKELLALGFSYTEQGALMADVMAGLRRQDPLAELTASQVAQRTREYAVHLATISDLTGKNARQLMEEGRKQTAKLAFQNFLQTFTDPNVRKRVEDAVSGIADPIMRQNLMERLTFGGVLNKTGAVLEAVNPALESLGIELAAAAKQGKGAEDFFKIQQKYSKSVNDGFLSQTEFNLAAMAPGSKIEALGTAAADARTYINQMATAAKTFAEKNAIGSTPTTGLAGQLIDMTVLGKDLEKALQEGVISRLYILKGHMNDYLGKIKSILDADVPSAKEIIKTQLDMMKTAMSDMAREYWEYIKQYAKEFWASAGLDTKGLLIGAGVVGLLYAVGKALGPLKTVLDGFRFMTGGGLPGTGGTVESGSGSGKRQLPPRDERGRFTKTPIPGGQSGGFGPPGRFESFLVNVFRALGTGAGALISGLMRGIATGIGAFANPKILLGAAIMSGAIAVLGLGIAAASWIMGKSLPTLAEGLEKFQRLDGQRLTQAGKGAAAVAAGVAAFTLLGSASVLSNLFNSLVSGLGSLFGVKSPLEKMMDFAKAGPDLERGGKGMASFVTSMKTFENIDAEKISKVATALAEVKASMTKGFFEFGSDIDAKKLEAIANAVQKMQGGLTAGITTSPKDKAGIGSWNGLRTYNGRLLVEIGSESILQLRGIKKPDDATKVSFSGPNDPYTARVNYRVGDAADGVVAVSAELVKLIDSQKTTLKTNNEEVTNMLGKLLTAYRENNSIAEDGVFQQRNTNRRLTAMT